MAYAREDIDRVRAATDLLDLVGSVTTVKRQGRSFKAVCPFHQEKTPSLSLDPARGLLYCFGCGWSGDAFTFVEQTQGLGFNEAVEELARRVNITLVQDPAAARRRSEREALVEVVRRAMGLYHEWLKTGPEAGRARAYLRSRGYGSDIVEQYRLGYAPGAEGRDALVRELRAGGVADGVLVGAGLARRGRGGRLYDYFHDRVLFPIHDLSASPVGFGGRLLGDGGPKYLNSPETRLYQKSKLLYGLHVAKTHIARAGYAVVVEGYTDVIGCHQAGVENAVATCGTALGDDHFDLLRRFADRVVLAFDADRAGAGAALRADELESPVRLDLDLRVAEMPLGVDPADLVQSGRADELQRAIDTSRPLLQFRIERELEAFDLSEPEARARALRKVGPLVARVGDEIARTEYLRFVAHRVGVELSTVERAVGGRSKVSPPTSATAPGDRRPPTGSELVERELLRALLANPSQLAGEDVDESLFSHETLRRAFVRLRPARDETAPGSPLPVLPGDDEASRLLMELALDSRPADDPGELLARARRHALERQAEELRRTLESLSSDDPRYAHVFEELIRLEHRKRNPEAG